MTRALSKDFCTRYPQNGGNPAVTKREHDTSPSATRRASVIWVSPSCTVKGAPRVLGMTRRYPGDCCDESGTYFLPDSQVREPPTASHPTSRWRRSRRQRRSGQCRFLPETSLAPFTARRERRDENDESDAHSIEIKIALRNEIHVDQMR